MVQAKKDKATTRLRYTREAFRCVESQDRVFLKFLELTEFAGWWVGVGEL